MLDQFLAELPASKALVTRGLTWFFAPAKREGPRIRPEAALASTQQFMQNYSHAAPFDPASLLQFWQRCGAKPEGVARCAPGLQYAEALVAGKAPPEPGRWLAPVPALHPHGAAGGEESEPDEEPAFAPDAPAEGSDAGEANESDRGGSPGPG